MSRAIVEKVEEGFPTTLPMTRSAMWSTQGLAMPAEGFSMVGLSQSENTLMSPVAELAYQSSPSDQQHFRFT